MDLLLIYKIVGVPIVFVAGAAFHFMFKVLGKRSWTAIFFPVNESIWEHLKIAFYPFLIYSLVQMVLIPFLPTNFLNAEFIGVYSTIAFIVVTELIYPRILKRNILAIDLVVFFLAILLGQMSSYYIIQNNIELMIPNIIIAFILLVNIGIFMYFSIKPPEISFFKDSISGRYGI